MHRTSTSMGPACDVCHTGTSRTPVYTWTSRGTANNIGLGCSGCHVAVGLRAHQELHGVTVCQDCHIPETPDPENVKPPYYGTADTKVKHPGNTVLAANTNENWSVGNYIGLDNDGTGLYDLADYTIGPFRIVSIVPEGNNMQVTWQAAGGRMDTMQAGSKCSTTFTNLSAGIKIPGVGLFTTNYLDMGGAMKGTRYYRLKSQYPWGRRRTVGACSAARGGMERCAWKR